MTLGLARNVVRLTPYDPTWVDAFLSEKRRIEGVFGNDVLGIEHIGSTAIPGMEAKSILDLMIAISSIEGEASDAILRLEKLGYALRRDNRSEQGHILFVKGSEENRTHYLKLTTRNSAFWHECILFRDYLIQHPERAEEYRRLKRYLLERYGDDRARYTKEKESFIKEMIRIAGECF